MTHFGLPISGSHSIIGGFVGAAVTKAGWGVVQFVALRKIILFIFFAPVIGLFVSFIFMTILIWIFRGFSPSSVNRTFGKLQLISASFYSLGHGFNDAQNAIGIITITLFSAGYLTGEFYVPTWVILASHGAIALGTYFGGWKVVKTMGMKITKLAPVHALSLKQPAL